MVPNEEVKGAEDWGDEEGEEPGVVIRQDLGLKVGDVLLQAHRYLAQDERQSGGGEEVRWGVICL